MNSKNRYGFSRRGADGEKRIEIRKTKSGRTPYNGFFTYCAPQNDQAAPYTFSVWLRSDHNGAIVSLGSNRLGFKNIALTTEWQRYSMTGILPPRVWRYHRLTLRMMKPEECVVWADAAQFEGGEAATEFEN